MSRRNNLNVHSISPLDNEIAEMKRQIQIDVGPYTNVPKIILIGNTGSGKSSLSCSLADLDLIIAEGAGRKLILNGEGVMAGGQSYTRQPQLIVDQQHRFILCDCPGFFDTSGTEQEIKNSFIIDYLFQSDPNAQSRFKVILVASYAEMSSNRGQNIADSIKIAMEMMQDSYQIEQGVGLVITKTESDRTSQDYIDELSLDPVDDMRRWCQFFSSHIDHVFTMPTPARSQLGQQYTFPDKPRLLNFLNRNFMINPKHKITLSPSARIQMENLQISHMQIVSDIIKQIFEKIAEKYKHEDRSINLENWLQLMNSMINRRIDNRISLAEFIDENIPNEGEFVPFIDELEHYETFDSFINRALNTQSISTSIQNAITTSLYDIIDELKTVIRYTKQIEEQMLNLQENEKKMDELRQESKELLLQLDEQKKVLQRTEQERNRLLSQLDGMQRQLEEQNRQIIELSKRKKSGGFLKVVTGIVGSVMTGNPMPAVIGIGSALDD